MLISNGQRLSCNPMRVMGGPGTSGTLTAVDSGAWGMKGARNNFYAGEATVISGASIANKSGFPDGYRPPYAWVMAIKAGGMTARFNITGEGDVSAANLAGGKNAEATIAGTGTLSAIGQLIVSLQAAIGGTGTISGADLKAFLALAAALSGSGGVSAQLTAIGHLASDLSGSGTVATSTVITALGELEASITVTGATLTTANVAAAVWSALAAAYNDAGTMGAKLNSASSAGDPWSTELPGSYASGEAGNIVGNLLTDLLDTQTVETSLTVRQALRVIAAALAGKVSGASGTTVTFRNAQADNKDRIVATVDSDGNRTAVTLDVT